MGDDQLTGRIRNAGEISSERLAELTSRFVAIPSVNGQHSEKELAHAITDELGKSGYQTEMVGSPSRPSLAVFGRGEHRVLLNGHLDTVPVEDADLWRFPPYEGVVADGAVHGRGACDMKGGLAIQVAVAQWLATEGRENHLMLHFAMGEERGEPGTEELLEAGFSAPIGMVLEPTDLQIGVAQRGLMTIRISLKGRAGHASRPDLTENPIELVPPTIATIEILQAHPPSHHEMLGSPTWTVTGVHSGVIPSMVPGTAEVLVDRRMIPGESTGSVLTTLEAALTDRLPGGTFSLEVAEEEGIYEPAEIDPGGTTVGLMTEALGMLGMKATWFGTPYSSDIRHLINTAGVEAVTYGPGRFSEMHARDEQIAIDDLTRGAHSVAAFVSLGIADSE